MVKTKLAYECSECGEIHSKWQGKCNSCGTWSTLTETIQNTATSSSNPRFQSLTQNSLVSY
jgi:DNA repair protein RadA/Sms